MKAKFVVLAVVFALSLVLPFADSALAAGYQYAIDTDIEVAENFATTIETTVSGKKAGAGNIPNAITIPGYGSAIESLKAKDIDGDDIPVEQSENGITLRLNSIQAAGGDWSIDVRYSTTLEVDFGSSAIIMIPPSDFGELKVVRERITINHDPALGSYVTRGASPSQTDSLGGVMSTSWENSTGPLASAVGLLFGDNAVSQVSFARTLQNDSLWWQTKSVVLPPDSNQQRSFINQISPKPTNVHLDIDGNVILDYRLGPKQKVDITADIEIAANSYTYSLSSEKLINDIDPLLVERYTSLNDTWQDSEVVIEEAETTAAYKVVESIYDEVAKQGKDADFNYDTALSLSNSLVGELRANRIPARLVVGAVFGDGAIATTTPLSHVWVEANLPDVGWVTLDPSFERNGDYFGVADVQRIALALRGFDPEYPPEDLASFTIAYNDKEIPTLPTMTPEIAATKYMLLPGVAIGSTKVEMPAGIIVDRAGLKVGDDAPRQLGSLAPFQSVQVRSLSLLADAFTSEAVQYGIISNGEISGEEVLVQTTMNVSYLPLILLVALAVLGFIFKKLAVAWWNRRKQRKANGQEKSSRSAKKIASQDAKGKEIENVDMLSNFDEVIEDSSVPEEDLVPAEQPVRESSVPQPRPPAQANMSAQPTPKTEVQESPQNVVRLDNAHRLHERDVRRETKRSRKQLIQ